MCTVSGQIRGHSSCSPGQLPNLGQVFDHAVTAACQGTPRGLCRESPDLPHGRQRGKRLLCADFPSLRTIVLPVRAHRGYRTPVILCGRRVDQAYLR